MLSYATHPGTDCLPCPSPRLLNRSLLSELLPVQMLRGLGLHALKSIKPLRQLVIREGLAPSYLNPSLMREGVATPAP